ncbi:putative aconitase, subunit [Acidilobus saccharovorans 345-15]|uniref:Phosphomevalonate dehydratase large subunit n=1 Tax=Acidilobus saccharovorans (strain DSM 16705 / JCM 18335 / VKM B-2471 / 345-15) TaxID=666510 RepID=D9PZT4_ACIS3|nr:aconitase X catalytic domain-containing protein [Acidilobus saccharovorans]ADL18572.1 putative aconitase, subunit [Acidilobus saccharovorans 345-15]
MYLTAEEERVLRGEEGEARAKALEVIVKVGEALGAERLQPIVHAHVSGVSYNNIGEPGRKFIEDLANMGARFSVPTTVNPIGFDLEAPEAFDLISADREVLEGQRAIVSALHRMGASLTLTCTPYYIPSVRGLRPGQSVAWGESNAVVYANSVLGLRTNREGGPVALMAAIAGRTYYYGMHVPEFRRPRAAYRLEAPGGYRLDYARAAVLGRVLVRLHRGEGPPLLDASVDRETFKELGAAVGAEGDIAMVFVPGLTPEEPPSRFEEVVTIDYRDVEAELESMRLDDVDLVYVGCPHASAEEVEALARELSRLKPKGNRPQLLITTSRDEERRISPEAMAVLREYGAVVLRDTCLIVSKLRREGLRVATYSYKAMFYLSRHGLRVGLESMEELARRLGSEA